MELSEKIHYEALLDRSYVKHLGKVAKVVGLTIESIGPMAKLNDLCLIRSNSAAGVVKAEVVGFRDDRVLLMPYDNVEGVGLGSWVENTGAPLQVPVSEELLGLTLDGVGEPMNADSLGADCAHYSVEAAPPDPLSRKLIDEVLTLGVKAVDGLLTIGKGQRIGIFAGSGVGKSTLMGMFARNTKADINVIALIGERGREVREFIERDLGEEGMRRSVVVVATSDKPALIRKKAAQTATAIAEYFRDQGKDVLQWHRGRLDWHLENRRYRVVIHRVCTLRCRNCLNAQEILIVVPSQAFIRFLSMETISTSRLPIRHEEF
mgnify:CR=1 FL=1